MMMGSVAIYGGEVCWDKHGGLGWCGGGGQKFYESGTGGAAGSGAVLVPILGSLFK